MKYYAHTADDESGVRLPEYRWQLLKDHLQNVAELAKRFALLFGMAAEAELAALLHDLGKYQPSFQDYLRYGKPRTPHAAVGAAAVTDRSAQIANVIASHHSGLYDWPELRPELLKIRQQRGRELSEYLASMANESGCTPPKLAARTDTAVLAELRTRLLFSALVDADYLDTETFHLLASDKTILRGGYPSIGEMANRLREHLDSLRERSQASSLNVLRGCINHTSGAVGEATGPGVFSLTVPTGGSKTLASANFALRHALKNEFERVIYVLPYTSIIEQNGLVFARIFGQDAVLEHHSLADWTSDQTEIRKWRSKLAAENWDIPFILTTNVQFFESLFSHRPSACRKLHRLLNSVVIFDECQTFPPDLLAPTLERLKALLSLGRTSLVLCTATQPAFQRQHGFPEGFEQITEIVPQEWKLHERAEFQRTRMRVQREPISLERLCHELREQDQALVVVNTRLQAWEAFSLLRSEGVFHLSTLMCPAHRRRVLAKIKKRLKRAAKCLVISTQLIEAGVDLDFPKVYRALAPLDSIIQAAGRCNREGRLLGKGEVVVFELEEHRLPGGVYRKGTQITKGILPDHIDGNFQPDTIYGYFQALYQLSNRDKYNFDRLSAEGCYRQIGEKYRWIESDTECVLTDYCAVGKRLQDEARANQYVPIGRSQFRQMSRFCINLRKSHVEQELRSSPKLVRLSNGLVLTQESYDPEFGYNHFGPVPPEVLIT